MGVGAGGLIGGLMFPGLDERLAQHITPNPNPLAQQGGPPNPKAVDSLGNPVPMQPQQNLAPAAVTQPDPVNASYAADLLKAARRDEMGQGINLGLDRIAAGFGTAQQQASKQATIAREHGVGGGLADLMGIQKMQDQTIADNEHSRFMANAAVFAQTLRGQGINVTDAQATEIMNNPGLLERFGAAAGGNATQTGTIKDANAATEAWARANPNATKQQIEDYRANIIAGGMGGNDIEQRQYLSERSAALGRGEQFPDFLTWKSQHANDAAVKANESKDAQDHKDTAIEGYTTSNEKLTKSEGTVDRLLKDIDKTMTALATPDMLSTGKGPAWLKKIPVVGGMLTPDKDTLGLAADIRTLKAELSGSALTDVKNVRNRQEFDTLGRALTAALDAANTPEDVQRALTEIKHKIASLKADVKASAGKPLTKAEAALANSTYITKTKKDGSANPYYGGSTILEDDEANAPAANASPAESSGGKPLSDAARAKAQELIKTDGRDAVIKHLRDAGYDTSGL
jgi:hypothetical protein